MRKFFKKNKIARQVQFVVLKNLQVFICTKFHEKSITLLLINDLSIKESQTDEILTVQSCHNFARLVITVLELRSSLPMKT
mgnify:CR=1 FL=1